MASGDRAQNPDTESASAQDLRGEILRSRRRSGLIWIWVIAAVMAAPLQAWAFWNFYGENVKKTARFALPLVSSADTHAPEADQARESDVQTAEPPAADAGETMPSATPAPETVPAEMAEAPESSNRDEESASSPIREETEPVDSAAESRVPTGVAPTGVAPTGVAPAEVATSEPADEASAAPPPVPPLPRDPEAVAEQSAATAPAQDPVRPEDMREEKLALLGDEATKPVTTAPEARGETPPPPPAIDSSAQEDSAPRPAPPPSTESTGSDVGAGEEARQDARAAALDERARQLSERPESAKPESVAEPAGDDGDSETSAAGKDTTALDPAVVAAAISRAAEIAAEEDANGTVAPMVADRQSGLTPERASSDAGVPNSESMAKPADALTRDSAEESDGNADKSDGDIVAMKDPAASASEKAPVVAPESAAAKPDATGKADVSPPVSPAPAVKANKVAGRPATKAPSVEKPEPAVQTGTPAGKPAAPAPVVAMKSKSEPAARQADEAQAYYRVQVGSYRSEEYARADWKRLFSREKEILQDIDHKIVEAKIEGRGTFHRIYVGAYRDRAGADRLCARLKARKLDCLVVYN